MYFLKVKMKNFGKTAYVIRKLRKKYAENVHHTIFLSTFSQYHKHELEIARFRARAPRAGTVDVKRLICIHAWCGNSIVYILNEEYCKT